MQGKRSNRYWVYILRCADNTLYTGIAKDPWKRLEKHNAGKGAKYTRGRLPVEFLFHECVEDLATALHYERKIKKLNRKHKFKLTALSELKSE